MQVKMKRRQTGLAGIISASLLALVPALPTVPVYAQSNTPVAVADAKADALLKQAAEQLHKSEGFTADYEIITEYRTLYKDTKEVGSVSLAKSNRLHIETDRFRRVRSDSQWEQTGNGSTVVSDGTNGWQLTRHPESAQYRTQPVTDAWITRALEPFAPVQDFFNTSKTPSTGRYIGQKTRDGETFDQIVVETPKETRTLSFDATGVLRGVEIIPQNPAGEEGFTRRTVFIQPWKELQADRFAFTPPADATLINGSGRRSDGLITIGSTAPDFAVEDASGKTVHLSDYAGKVVVLKFWATWCWPCRQSLPETEKVAQEYKGKNVVVLAVALWDSRKAFRNWTTAYQKNHNSSLQFAFDPQPQGKDFASTLYGVTATPTEFVIGKDGRISAALVSYNGPSDRERLAVQEALALPIAQVNTPGVGK